MREEYRPVAHNGRVLFVCLLELRRLDPVYQFSQLWFTSLFSRVSFSRECGQSGRPALV